MQGLQKKNPDAPCRRAERGPAADHRLHRSVASSDRQHHARDEHSRPLNSNPTHPYVAINDMPKLNNLERQYPDLYREQPALVFDDGDEVGADQKTAATVTPAIVGHTQKVASQRRYRSTLFGSV